MSSLDWAAFYSLTGNRTQNFENLCRALIRLHFGRYGKFAALKNQPGVEFHLKLSDNCSQLGGPPRWYGWQCKIHQLTTTGDLASAARKDIKDSLLKTEKYLPDLTDWVLWTPYTLSKGDQDWFKSLQSKFELHQWAEEEIDTYLNGPGLMLRSSNFGDLVVTSEELEQRHREAVQPIRERWIEPVHQSVKVERTIRRMLGEPGSWDRLIVVGQRLKKAAEVISNFQAVPTTKVKKTITSFVIAPSAFADTLLHFHEILADGDLDIIHQKLRERKSLIDLVVRATPRLLRTLNLHVSLDATNALDDMYIAEVLLDEVEEFLCVGLVAVLADAGGGKTQLAAQLTAPQKGRPAGVLLHGRDLHRGQTLDDLVHRMSINGNPLTSIERLLASLDAAGKRSRCRLPVVVDGLNEAEHPKDWKAQLSILCETIKRYPNVLFVCTLRTGEHRRDDNMGRPSQNNARESFAVMALPDDVMKIESEGFGGDVDDAIKKYFNYFKINPGDTEIPIDLLQHPLTLRIFCEVTNPKRKTEVKVEYFPASLSPLFEKYVANACERISQMTNLSHSYTATEVETAIYNFGLVLWDAKKRYACESNYRSSVSDIERPWDSSIVNLLAQEGVIFRNPGKEPGKFVITPVFDALGGYLVANSLLAKYSSDWTFEWLKSPETTASFMGDNSHELAVDIFRSMVALTPRRMHGKNLWKEAPDPFRIVALRFATRIDAKYLDKETVDTLFDLLKNNSKVRTGLFPRLQRLRAVVNHPFNSDFLDSILRFLSIAERDLSWTEWVRRTREKRFDDIIAMEIKWKESLATRTLSDRLRAKWIKWHLTSTDHELRDIATRALYWFGRGIPEALFEESLRSLEINDPYVPERMLAASYGVAMARHVELHDDTFVKVTLPKFAKQLYNLFFADGSVYYTTHLLYREYATKIIELAVLHNPGIFSTEEIERSNPSYSNRAVPVWDESKASKEKLHGHDSPFRMDFENYTIGRLVKDRRNYDFKHEGYKKIRTQILWRVEQLGWSNERFKEVETSIENNKQWPRIGGEAKKIDRYGKKYSWIAFFEMSGVLCDQGALENWRERTSSVDIDPSFPEPAIQGRLIENDFLGNTKIEMKEWIAHGELPDMNPYLRMAEIQKEEGPWVALDGFINQQDEKRGRKMFCFIRSFLIAGQDVDSFFGHLSSQDLGGRWLPEKPNVIYTFAGEIPWSKTFPESGQSEFSFIIKKKKIKAYHPQQILYLDGKRLELTQTDLIRRRLFNNVAEGKEKYKTIMDEDINHIEIREELVEVEEIQNEYAKYNALIPVCDFGWEGYQTVASEAGHAISLAKEISIGLDLIGKPQTFDLFTKDNVQATFNISYRPDDYNNHQSMFFIKENLLKKYLQNNALAFVWAIWGEREYSNSQIEKLFHGPNRPDQPYAVFSYVKRFE